MGWRGTGYKFAPSVGRTLFQLAEQGGTIHDIARFAPSRFADGKTARGAMKPSLQQRLADGVIIGAEGYVFELKRRGHTSRPGRTCPR